MSLLSLPVRQEKKWNLFGKIGKCPLPPHPKVRRNGISTVGKMPTLQHGCLSAPLVCAERVKQQDRQTNKKRKKLLYSTKQPGKIIRASLKESRILVENFKI